MLYHDAVRSPLPRSMLTRLETGRLVVLSLLLGGVVGGLCIVLRRVLEYALQLGTWVHGYAPPGVPGEGGLLMAFGDALPWAMLVLPFLGALYAWLVPAQYGGGLNQLVAGYHARGQWPPVSVQLRTLLATILGYGSGLLLGRDSAFTMMGQLSARLMHRFTKMDPIEYRTLTLAGAAAALGAVLHAPLAAAVLIAEVLYRRFEFEVEVVMACVLAAVSGTAIYGMAFGFTPLFSLPVVQVPAAAQVPAFVLVALLVTLCGWLTSQASQALPEAWVSGWTRPLVGAAFGFLTASIAVFSTPAVLGDGSGWVQLSASGFIGPEGVGQGLWRWLLLAIGVRIAFGGGVLPSVGVGGLLGGGLGSTFGIDPAIATMVGAVAFLTVSLNTPLAAALLGVAWGSEAMMPICLVAAGLAHAISGTTSVLPAQLNSRRESGVHAGGPVLLPDTVRYIPRRTVETDTAGVPFDAPNIPSLTAAESEAASSLSSDRELYRRSVPPSWRGARLNLLSLPPGVEVVGVVRDGTVRLPRPELRLTADDELVFLARPDAYAALEGILRLPGA